MLDHLDKSKLYYLASPYSHPNRFVRQVRYEATIYAASQLTCEGFRLLEPIAMCHEQSDRYDMPSGYQFWKTRDRGFIDLCDGVILLKLKGWQVSEGVTDELYYAKRKGKHITHLETSLVIPKDVWEEIR